jgi:hypothetical protein
MRLPLDLRLTPEQFGLVCVENREAVLELDADGRLIAITPTGSETGSRSGMGKGLQLLNLFFAEKTAEASDVQAPRGTSGDTTNSIGYFPDGTLGGNTGRASSSIYFFSNEAPQNPPNLLLVWNGLEHISTYKHSPKVFNSYSLLR